MRQFAAWIACFAILMAVLAPSVSHALTAATGGGTRWLEICSATGGSKFIEVTAAQDPTAPVPVDHVKHLAHCPVCCSHTGAFDLPPTLTFAVVALDNRPAFPPLYYQSPRPLFLWTAAQSRAPPFTS